MVGIAAAWFVLRPGDAPSADIPAPAYPVTFDVQWPPLDGLEHTVCNDGTGGASYESAQDHWCWRSFFGEVDLSGDVAGVALWTMRGNVGVPGTREMRPSSCRRRSTARTSSRPTWRAAARVNS